jgi:hypothetical protein
MIICGILLPTVVAAVWKIKTREPISTILIGAVIFAVFALGLESIPKAFLTRYSSSAIMQGAAEVIAYGTAVKFF